MLSRNEMAYVLKIYKLKIDYNKANFLRIYTLTRIYKSIY